MSVLVMVIVAILSSAVTTAVTLTVVNAKIRKRLHGNSPVSTFVSMGHQYFVDNTWREHKFQAEKKQMMLQAEEARKEREKRARLETIRIVEAVYNQRDYE